MQLYIQYGAFNFPSLDFFNILRIHIYTEHKYKLLVDLLKVCICKKISYYIGRWANEVSERMLYTRQVTMWN